MLRNAEIHEVVWPRAARPRNGPLKAHGYDLPPASGIRRVRRRHFARQELTGTLLFLGVTAGVGYMMYLVAMS